MGPLSGQLIFYFLIAVIDAALLSWLALAWYRRSMRTLMSARAPGGRTHDDPQGVPAATPDQGDVDPAHASSARAAHARSAHRIRRARLRLTVAYATGATLYAAVIAFLHLRGAMGTLPAVAWFADWWINLWPIAPTLAAVLALDRRAGLTLTGTYVAAGCVLMACATLAGQVLRGSFSTAPITNVIWMLAGLVWIALPPFALLLLTGWRPIRAVMPVALAATLLFAGASLTFKEGFVRALEIDAALSAVLSLGQLTSQEVVHYGLFMLASLPVGWVAWRTLKRVASRFAAKRFSDVQLIVECWWVVVCVTETLTVLWPTYGARAIAGGLAAYGAYRAGVSVVLRAWPVDAVTDAPALLLLRVFGYQARTEALFDRLAGWWRFRGPVHLIAGVDLATRTADAADMLALVGRRLQDLYVCGLEAVPQRIAKLDRRVDPDGRFRINDVYCHDDTWRASLEALLDASDHVLMDLRSFTRQNAGCVFELEQIARRAGGGNVVLVCDRTTDLDLVDEVVRAAGAPAPSDDVAPEASGIAIVRVERQSHREIAEVMRRLAVR